MVLVAAVAVLLSRGDDATPGPGAGGPGPQLTTLVQVTGADGTAAASALLGTSRREGRAVSVLVPSRLIVDVAGSGDMPFGEAVTLPEASASAGALTDLLGVRVEDSWVLTPEALAALVDAVGGVSAAVDVNVVELLRSLPLGNGFPRTLRTTA